MVFCATALTLIASEGFFPVRQVSRLLTLRTTLNKAPTPSSLRSHELRACACEAVGIPVRIDIQMFSWQVSG